ncbi:MAG: ATP-binding cassette domain-containing protein, partial [Bacilli bacterium]
RNENIGYITQGFALIDDYKVSENILLPSLYNKALSKEEATSKAKELCYHFKIESIYNHKIKDISGGQKQRVALSRALLLDPIIILADEPTSNLDKENFKTVIDSFIELVSKGKTIIVATHDERMYQFADKVYEIIDYKIVEAIK